MGDVTPISIGEQLACIEREIGFRVKCYPRWVKQGKLTQAAFFKAAVDAGGLTGLGNVVAGLPCKKAATTPEEVARHTPSMVEQQLANSSRRKPSGETQNDV